MDRKLFGLILSTWTPVQQGRPATCNACSPSDDKDTTLGDGAEYCSFDISKNLVLLFSSYHRRLPNLFSFLTLVRVGTTPIPMHMKDLDFLA